FFFFFQAEDGIRDATVTGVQTCALPIYQANGQESTVPTVMWPREDLQANVETFEADSLDCSGRHALPISDYLSMAEDSFEREGRSEERRVGKEGRCRRSRDDEVKRNRK